MSDAILVWGIFGLIMALVLFIGYSAVKGTNERRSQKLKDLGSDGLPAETFWFGEYIAGLSRRTTQTQATCAVTTDHLVFLDSDSGELGRIPRDGVTEVIVEDKTRVTQRLTVTRIATLGVFALAVPKKEQHPEYCLVIDWEDETGVRQNSVFKFAGVEGATAAANKLRAVLRPKVVRLSPDEKKCPFCAETVKQAAVVCKHCRSEL